VPALEIIGRDLTVCTVDRRADGVEDEIAQLEQDLIALDALVESYKARLLAGCDPVEILAEAAEHRAMEAARLAEMTADAPKPQDDDPMDGHILTDKETVSCGDAANNGPSCGDGSHMADVTQPLSAAPACVDSPPTINAQGLAGDFLVESDSTPATLKLGDINIRLGFTMTADFVASTLGMPWRDTAKSAKLWRESDWPLIKAALVKHVEGLL